MKYAILTVEADNDVLIQRSLAHIAEQIAGGYTSGASPDGSTCWDLSTSEE